MARPYWSGQIQISLVSFGVKLFVATEAKSDIHFHQIDRFTGEAFAHERKVRAAVLQTGAREVARDPRRGRIDRVIGAAKGVGRAVAQGNCAAGGR